MTPENFLQQLQNIIVGGTGFVRQVPIPLGAITAADGAPPGSGTGLQFASVETNGIALQWPSGDTTEIALPFVLPDDYDQDVDADYLKLRLLAEMGGSTDTPAFTAEAYVKSAGADLGSDLGPDNTADLSDSAAWVDVDLSGNGLTGKDAVQFFLTPQAHGTDALNVYAAMLEYKSCLVPYQYDDRS